MHFETSYTYVTIERKGPFLQQTTIVILKNTFLNAAKKAPNHFERKERIKIVGLSVLLAKTASSSVLQQVVIVQATPQAWKIIIHGLYG